jgi:hypothetical protein
MTSTLLASDKADDSIATGEDSFRRAIRFEDSARTGSSVASPSRTGVSELLVVGATASSEELLAWLPNGSHEELPPKAEHPCMQAIIERMAPRISIREVFCFMALPGVLSLNSLLKM